MAKLKHTQSALHNMQDDLPPLIRLSLFRQACGLCWLVGGMKIRVQCSGSAQILHLLAFLVVLKGSNQ